VLRSPRDARGPGTRPLADFAPTIVPKAKDFAAGITIFNSGAHRLSTGDLISREHVTNSEAMRGTLLERGIWPEHLPPAEDVRKVERRLTADGRKSLRNPEGLEN
jgi:DNA-damage-inducible protein D